MKNTTKAIATVFAVFLVASLFIGTASASEYRDVDQNGVAFVYEKITIEGATISDPLVLYGDDTKTNVVNSISASTMADGSTKYYNLLADVVGSKYGRYYYDTTNNYYVDIWYPELVVKAELAASAGDSIIGKTVTKSTDVKFIIQAPKVGPASDAATVSDLAGISQLNSNMNSLKTYNTTYYGLTYNDDANATKLDGAKADISATIGAVNATLNVLYPTSAPSAAALKSAADNITSLKASKLTTVTASQFKNNLSQFYNAAIDVNAKPVEAFIPGAKLVFTTPAGGKTTTFNTVSFATILFNGQVEVSKQAVANVDAGTWTVQAEFIAPKSFSDYAEKSNTGSFTVQSSTLTITAGKDSVVRSNPFTVTISGEPQIVYTVQIEDPSTSDWNPTLTAGQIGYQAGTNISITDKSGKHDIGGQFKTDASGKRTVQFETTAETEDKTYTIRVDGSTAGDYDKVKIKVEKGAVTIAASGDGSYYLGDEIKLTGTNTDSDEIWLFVTGPNLAYTDGVVLKQLPTQTAAYLAVSSDKVSVKTDNTWEYKWDTSKIGLDTGAYTIYATSVLTNGKSSSPMMSAVKLSDSEYATVSVNLKQPFLSAVPSGTTVAKGDKIYIKGTAEGDPSYLQLYIFGPNKYSTETITVEDDGTYNKKLEIDSNWASNQYFVVIEHPMYNNVIDVDEKYYDKNGDEVPSKTSTGYKYTTLEIQNFGNSSTVGLQSSFVVEGTNKLQGSNAANALTQMIDSANIDDIYTKLTFTVAEPWIKIMNPGDQAMGSKFTITGTTNLAADDQILVEVVSSSFNAVDKTSTSVTSGVSQTTKVVAGDGGDNTWSIEVDTTNWKLDEYTIKAQGIEVDVTTTTNFNLVEKVVTPTPTATGATPTTTATATATATETPKTPGFGAFIALAGLGAVALLVLRRN